MAKPELVLAALLVGLTLGVLLLWPASAPLAVVLRVLGAWLLAFLLWGAYALALVAFNERTRTREKRSGPPDPNS